MCKSEFEDKNWFYINNRRAMVSLGPLSEKKTCPYSCAFCYVQDGFVSYAQKTNDEIVDFLVRHREEYDIIYISGDTDSFAPPRRVLGLSLLQSIAEAMDVDLLFTTRTVFSSSDFVVLQNVVKTLNLKGCELFACVSITRFSDDVSYLEPSPIPKPEERIKTIKQLHDIGAVTVLALRPFIPVVNIADYFKILKLSEKFVDIVLGETFYFQLGGKIEKRVFPVGVPKEMYRNLKTAKMDFDKTDVDWSVWDGKRVECTLQDYCKEHNIIFSMRSAPAILAYKRIKKSI